MSKAPFALVVGAVAVALTIMALLGNADAKEAERIEMRYCESVAKWKAQAARGVDPLHRSGHPDFKNVAADACPGLRPAE